MPGFSELQPATYFRAIPKANGGKDFTARQGGTLVAAGSRNQTRDHQ